MEGRKLYENSDYKYKTDAVPYDTYGGSLGKIAARVNRRRCKSESLDKHPYELAKEKSPTHQKLVNIDNYDRHMKQPKNGQNDLSSVKITSFPATLNGRESPVNYSRSGYTPGAYSPERILNRFATRITSYSPTLPPTQAQPLKYPSANNRSYDQTVCKINSISSQRHATVVEATTKVEAIFADVERSISPGLQPLKGLANRKKSPVGILKNTKQNIPSSQPRTTDRRRKQRAQSESDYICGYVEYHRQSECNSPLQSSRTLSKRMKDSNSPLYYQPTPTVLKNQMTHLRQNGVEARNGFTNLKAEQAKKASNNDCSNGCLRTTAITNDAEMNEFPAQVAPSPSPVNGAPAKKAPRKVVRKSKSKGAKMKLKNSDSNLNGLIEDKKPISQAGWGSAECPMDIDVIAAPALMGKAFDIGKPPTENGDACLLRESKISTMAPIGKDSKRTPASRDSRLSTTTPPCSRLSTGSPPDSRLSTGSPPGSRLSTGSPPGPRMSTVSAVVKDLRLSTPSPVIFRDSRLSTPSPVVKDSRLSTPLPVVEDSRLSTYSPARRDSRPLSYSPMLPQPEDIRRAVDVLTDEDSPWRLAKCLENCLRPSLFPRVPPYIKFSSHEEGTAVKPPLAIQKQLKWKVTTITPIIVKRTLTNTGFRLLKSDCDTSETPQDETLDWIGIWGKHMKSPMFRCLKDNQKMNHFPGTFQIGRKDRLWRNLQKLVIKHGSSEFGIMPKTYVLPHDLKLLKRDWEKYAEQEEKWIIKPPASARGTGIKVVSRWSQIPKKRAVVVQKYVSKPYLINGSKFDMRLYVLVTSIHPLRIFLYKEGLARFASVKYTDDAGTLHDRFMHLTNYSINRLSKNYTHNEDANACQGHKWTLQALFQYLKNQRRVDTDALWESLKDVVIKTILSGEQSITSLTKGNVMSRYSCYELFGIDILLDENLKPWLLEVNISPSLHSASPLDIFVKGPLVTAVLNTAQFHVPSVSSSNHKNTEILKGVPYDPKLYTVYLSKEERDKHIIYSKMETRIEYLDTILSSLTPDDVRHLIQAEDELTQAKDGLERIFPTAETHRYLEFLNAHRYYNRLLDAWEQRHRECRQSGIDLLRNLCDIGYHLEVPPVPLKCDDDDSESAVISGGVQECHGEGAASDLGSSRNSVASTPNHCAEDYATQNGVQQAMPVEQRA